MIQSVIIDKTKFSRQAAIAWIKKNHFIPNTSAPNFSTTSFYRFRQIDPKVGYRYRTKIISPGISLILAYSSTKRKYSRKNNRGSRKMS